MTSELKPCPFCQTVKFLEIDEYYEPFNKGYFGFTVICNAAGLDGSDKGCGASGAWGETEEEAARIWNTRAVPDVSELVRYDHSLVGTREDKSGMLEDANGEYVRYDQAAAMLAAKDAVIERLSEQCHGINAELQGVYERAEAAEAERDAIRDDRFDGLWRFWNGKARELSQRNVALAAELAQIKAQVPVVWRGKFRANSSEFWEYYAHPDSGFDPDKYEQQALYAAPIDQSAEDIIKELESIIEYWMDTPKFIKGYATKPISELIKKYKKTSGE